MLGKMVKFNLGRQIGYALAEDANDYCVLFEHTTGNPMSLTIKLLKDAWEWEIKSGSFKLKVPDVIPHGNYHIYWVKKSDAKLVIQNVE